MYCRTLLNVIREAKRNHFSKQIENSKNNMKTIWDITRQLTGTKAKNDDGYQYNTHDNTSHDSQILPEYFNNHFLSTTGKHHNIPLLNEKFSAYLNTIDNVPYPNINYRYTSTKEIEQIISSLKPKNSHGYDEVCVNILKSSSPYISSPLCHICNKMLSTGMFPDRLKCAVVKPIFKNGEKSDASNYRPISLLPAFSKVLGKVIYVRLYKHLSNNSILIDEQFGFRPKSSTTAAAYNLINEVLEALN